MSWVCPHQIKGHFCKLRKKECQPGSEGCVLEGKIRPVETKDNEGDGEPDHKP